MSVPDLIDLLFDAMHDLVYFETAVEAGSYCLASLLKLLPSRAGLVHLYDIDTREFVTVYAQGPKSERLLLSRTPEADALLSMAMYKHRAHTVRYGEHGPARLERHELLGEAKSILVAPVLDGGRFLGAIELIDPEHEDGFDIRAENAASYVADRYAEFLVERGVAIGNVVAPPSAVVCAEGDVSESAVGAA